MPIVFDLSNMCEEIHYFICIVDIDEEQSLTLLVDWLFLQVSYYSPLACGHITFSLDWMFGLEFDKQLDTKFNQVQFLVKLEERII